MAPRLYIWSLHLLIMRYLKLLCLPVLFMAGTVTSQTLQQQLNTIAENFQLMGMSVVTLCDGEIDEVFNYGLRDFQRQLPYDDDTKLRIASVSKAITATGLMILVDEGAINLNDDISQYLGFTARNPQYPNVPITVRMVVSHTSSIQDGSGYSPFLSATVGAPGLPPSISSVLVPGGTYYTNNIWRTESPGSFFAYSNLNYGVLASVIEAASGMRFDEFMADRIFDPLGLTCSYNVASLPDIDELGVIYRNQGGWTPQIDNFQGVAPAQPNLTGYVPGTNGSRFGPQGGLRASTLELARLMLLHMNNGYDPVSDTQLLSTATMELMHTPVWTFNGSNGDNYFNLFNQWGLGIQQTTNAPMGDIVIPGVPMLGHAGEAYGLVSDWYFNKDTGRGIIFMTNGIWPGYSFGNSSAFYTLEEAVFSAVANQDNCAQSFCEDPQPWYLDLDGDGFGTEENATEPLCADPCDGAFNVGVSGTGWMDEISWTLTDNTGTVILSGGPYANTQNGGFFTAQIITSNTPLTFSIETQGQWNDNDVNWSISTGTGFALASGFAAGGTLNNEEGILCSYAPEAGDCDDTNPLVYPDAPGTGEGIDNNCDGLISGDELSGCLGDFNQNGLIDTGDLLILLADFGCLQNCQADLNGSGNVGSEDLLIFLPIFGTICP